MHEEILSLVIKLLCIFMKERIVSNLSLPKLFKIELNDQASLKPALDLGCAATNLLSNLRKKDLVEEQKILNFNKECRVFVTKAVESLRSRTFVYLDQGSAGSWCSRAKFQVFKVFAGRSFSFSDI